MVKAIFCAFLIMGALQVILGSSSLCENFPCDVNKCPELKTCDLSDHVVERGGYCLCCFYCKKIIGLGKSCKELSSPPIQDPEGNYLTRVKCDRGLVCDPKTLTCTKS